MADISRRGLDALVGRHDLLIRDAIQLASFVTDCVPEDLPDRRGGLRTAAARARAAALLSGYTERCSAAEAAFEKLQRDEILRGAAILGATLGVED